jgi:hypothetical protein
MSLGTGRDAPEVLVHELRGFLRIEVTDEHERGVAGHIVRPEEVPDVIH